MRSSIITLCLVSSLVSSVVAQGYSTDFETFTASTSGTPCAGQNGFYVGPVAGSVDAAIFTYAGNGLGVPANPNGGSNFYCGYVTTAPIRAQHSLTLPASGRVRVQFDVLCNFIQFLSFAPGNNLGGFSFQPSTTQAYVNLLARWPVGVTNPPTTWDADTVFGPTAAGTVTAMGPLHPGFTGLAVNVWHTWAVTIDLTTKVYLDWRITNGVTNVTSIYTPPLPVPMPGQATGLPTDFRFFTGNVGNVFAVDNLQIAYAATYSTFGAGCAGAMGVPTLAAAPGSLPAVGTTLTVDLGNLPLNLAVMCTGFSNTLAAGSIALPYDLGSAGFPGCNLLVDPLSTEFLFGAANTASWTLTVPASMSFIGLEMFQQGLSLDTGPTGAAFSNGGRFIIGL